jgi:hypothetical protein
MEVKELLQELEAELIFQDSQFEFNSEHIESLNKIPLKERKLKWKFEIELDKFHEDKESPYFNEEYFDYFEIDGNRKTNKTTIYSDLAISLYSGDISQINPRKVPVFNSLKFRGRFFKDYEESNRDRIFERIKYLIGLSFPNAQFKLKV